MMEYRNIFQATLNKWGRDAQFDQAVEECAELIAALKHFRRGKVDQSRVVDELADVWLMVGQLAYIFGEEEVDRAVGEKVEKLKKLLQKP